ncbi:MAG: hypothetical protein IJ091_04165 [Oscillospiraceae bacterium]|nr:hypothetical protein [Oscillospiraceae bacterium]
MKRIFRLYFLFLIPFFLIRLATLSQTDRVTGFFYGGSYGRFLFLFSLALACVTALAAGLRIKNKQVEPQPPKAASLLLQIVLCLAALFTLQQILIPPLTSKISSRALSLGVFALYAVSHVFAAAFYFLLAANASLPTTLLSDLFAASPAVAFTSQLLFLYAQSPVNLHDSLTVLSLLCEAALAVAWLRYCSAVLAGSTVAFPSAVGFSVLAVYLAIGFRLPELFMNGGRLSFLNVISLLQHTFCALTLMILTLSSIPDKRAASDSEERNENDV